MPIEGVGLDDVCAGLKVRAMDFQNRVRPREYKMIVATFERRSSKILGSQLLLLDHGAHGAIEDENACFERFKQRLLTVVHALLISVYRVEVLRCVEINPGHLRVTVKIPVRGVYRPIAIERN